MNSVQRIANIILIGAGSCCIVFFFVNVTRHGWAPHYILFPGLAAVFLTVLRLHTSIRVNLALFLVSAALALYGAEALLGQVILSSNRFSMNDWLNFPSWQGQMYFVYLPTWERYRLPDLASKDRETVLRIVHGLALPTVDVHLSFSRHPDPLSLFPSRRYAHYNSAGHRLVAEEVMTHLEKAKRLVTAERRG